MGAEELPQAEKQGSPWENLAAPMRLSHKSESLMGRRSDGLDVLFHYAGSSLNASSPNLSGLIYTLGRRGCTYQLKNSLIKF